MGDIPLEYPGQYQGLLKFQPKFVNLIEAVPQRYMVFLNRSSDGKHVYFSFGRVYGYGYATKKEAYAAAKKWLEDEGHPGRAFLLKLDLGKEGE